MSTVKITDLPKITLDANTSNSIFVMVDITSDTTNMVTGTQIANNLYLNNTLNVGANPVLLHDVSAQFSGNNADYLQINNQNFASSGSVDYIGTADIGSDANNYIDFGINNSTYSDPLYSSSKALDGYLYVHGSTDQSYTGNLVLGTSSSHANVVLIAGGTTSSNVVGRISSSVFDLLKDVRVTGNTSVTGSYVFNDGTIQSTSANTTINSANTWLQANDLTTLTTAKSYTDAANTWLQANTGAGIIAANTSLKSYVDNTVAASLQSQITSNVNVLNASVSSAYSRANTSANSFVGTTGSATPASGVVTLTSGNGVTTVGSGSTITINTAQDIRTTASPAFNALTLANALPLASGGTGVTTSTGSGSVVLSTSPTLVTPILGTPTSGTLTNCTGYTYANLSGTTPTWNQNTTGTASNITGTLAVSQGGSGATATTGSGNNVLSTSPTLVTPNLGTPTTLVGTNITGTAASLTVGNATTASNLNGTWAQMPAGTVTNFFQASAPTGWTQNTSYSNHMMRIVSGAGGGSGGTMSPILNNVVPSHTHGFSTGGASANHVHYDAGHSHSFNIYNAGVYGSGPGANVARWGINSSTDTGYASIGYMSNDHSHSGSTDNGSSQTNWTPQYIDNILCSKN